MEIMKMKAHKFKIMLFLIHTHTTISYFFQTYLNIKKTQRFNNRVSRLIKQQKKWHSKDMNYMLKIQK